MIVTMNSRDIISLKNFRTQYPHCFQEYQKMKGDTFNTLNSALDSLLFNFGIGIVVQPVYSNNDKFLGNVSSIKIYPFNKIGEQSSENKYIEDYKKFKIAEKATKVTTLKALEILEDAFVFGRVKSQG